MEGTAMLETLFLLLTCLLPVQSVKFIDLSHELKDSSFYFKTLGDAKPYQRTVYYKADILPGVFLDIGHLAHTEHAGTHVDVPSHYKRGGAPAAQVPVEWTVADGVMIDCSEEAKTNPAYLVTVQKIQAWEEEHGKIPDEAAILFNFNWSRKYEKDIDDYKGAKGEDLFTFVFPTISKEAGRWLMDNRNPKMLGVDVFSPDPFTINGKKVKDLPNHVLYMGRNKIFVENLKEPFRLPARGFRFHATPARYADASGTPVRAYAIIDEGSSNTAGRQEIAKFGLLLTLLSAIICLTRFVS